MSTILNARSPYYIKIAPAANTITSVTLSLYVYSGTFTTDKPSTASYTITKTPIGTNNYVIYEISSLVKDFLDTEYGNFSTDGVWVEADSAITTNAGSESQTLDFLGFEGFGYFQNGVNPRQSTNPINTLVTGTTDGVTVAFKLQDSTQSFINTVNLGDTVNNISFTHIIFTVILGGMLIHSSQFLYINRKNKTVQKYIGAASIINII